MRFSDDIDNPTGFGVAEFELVNGRLAMKLTSNLALSSSASAISGNDIYGADESASSNGACLHIHRPHLFPPFAAVALLHRARTAGYDRQQAGSLTPGLGISPMIRGVMSSITRARMRASADFVHIAHTAPRRCSAGRSSRIAKTLH